MLSLPTCPPWSSTAIQPCTAQECATTTRQACCKCFQQATSRYRARTPQKSSRRNLTKKQSRTHELTALTSFFPVAGRMSAGRAARPRPGPDRSEEHTSELQSLMRTSYAVFCLKKNNKAHNTKNHPEVTTTQT